MKTARWFMIVSAAVASVAMTVEAADQPPRAQKISVERASGVVVQPSGPERTPTAPRSVNTKVTRIELQKVPVAGRSIANPAGELRALRGRGDTPLAVVNETTPVVVPRQPQSRLVRFGVTRASIPRVVPRAPIISPAGVVRPAPPTLVEKRQRQNRVTVEQFGR